MTMAVSFFEPCGQAAPDNQLVHHISGGWIAQAVRVAADLGIADLIADGTSSSDRLAQLTNTHARAVSAAEDACKRRDLFRDRAGLLRPDARGDLLRSDAPISLRGRARFTDRDVQWSTWGQLGYSVRTSEPAFTHGHGLDLWEYRARHPDANAVFNAGMNSLSLLDGKARVEAYDYEGEPAG
jgi:hypothetical protein